MQFSNNHVFLYIGHNKMQENGKLIPDCCKQNKLYLQQEKLDTRTRHQFTRHWRFFRLLRTIKNIFDFYTSHLFLFLYFLFPSILCMSPSSFYLSISMFISSYLLFIYLHIFFHISLLSFIFFYLFSLYHFFYLFSIFPFSSLFYFQFLISFPSFYLSWQLSDWLRGRSPFPTTRQVRHSAL